MNTENTRKTPKTQLRKKVCVLLSKVDRRALARRRERRDPHQRPRLRTTLVPRAAEPARPRRQSRRPNPKMKPSWRAGSIVKTVCFEQAGNKWKKSGSELPRGPTKVDPALTGLTRERCDLYEPPRLRTTLCSSVSGRPLKYRACQQK